MEPYVCVDSNDPRLVSLDFVVNQYVAVDGKAYRFDGTTLVPARWTNIKSFKPKNVEQMMLFDLLDNDDVSIKVVQGVAGSGKTKAALQYGLTKVLDGRKFDRLLIVRQPAVVGEEIGHLKGDLNGKLAPWQNAIVDNLANGRQQFDELVYLRKLEFDIPAFMQGRDLKHMFIVVDEAQMLTRKQMQMLGTRCSEGSVIVFLGDTDQIMNRKYEADNGLRQVVDRLAGRREFGCVRLNTSVRSTVAELFATRM